MATRIKFTYNDRDYCLEYTRQTVKTMEKRGFVLEKIIAAPLTYLPELFAGAFEANHQFTNRKIIDEIFDQMKDKQQLVDTLTRMYNEPIEALMESEDEGNGIAWETT